MTTTTTVGASCIDCGEYRGEGHEADCPAHHDAYWCGLGQCPDEHKCPHLSYRCSDAACCAPYGPFRSEVQV